MSVKMFLMWNSRMLIDVGGDASVETSLLEASNLVVLKVNTCYFVEFTGIGFIDVEFTGIYLTNLLHGRNHLSYTPMQILEFMDKVF